MSAPSASSPELLDGRGVLDSVPSAVFLYISRATGWQGYLSLRPPLFHSVLLRFLEVLNYKGPLDSAPSAISLDGKVI